MGLLTSSEEKRTQLYFRDDRKFQFRKMTLEHSCIVEKADGKYKRAWKHFYNSEIPFSGYKNISGDSVTLSYSRDIILDPFNRVKIGKNPGDKPSTDESSLKVWISKIATNMRHVYSTKRETRSAGDVIFWLIIGIDIVLLIGWAIKFFTG
jgi:hypothetical protein